MLDKCVFTDYNKATELYRSKQATREEFLKKKDEEKLTTINNMTDSQLLDIVNRCLNDKCVGCPLKGTIEYANQWCDEIIMNRLKERLGKDTTNESN